MNDENKTRDLVEKLRLKGELNLVIEAVLRLAELHKDDSELALIVEELKNRQ